MHIASYSFKSFAAFICFPTSTEHLNIMPSSFISFILRSITDLFSLKSGIPYRSNPPGFSSFSNTVTVYPFRFKRLAQANPEGPDPITATFLPFRIFGIWGVIYPSAKAFSIIAASFSRIVTGSPILFKTQPFSHKAGHTRPVNSGKSSVATNSL